MRSFHAFVVHPNGSDGGGIRGLSELLILQEIMSRLGNYPGTDELVKPCQVFDLICGTSTGGLVGHPEEA